MVTFNLIFINLLELHLFLIWLSLDDYKILENDNFDLFWIAPIHYVHKSTQTRNLFKSTLMKIPSLSCITPPKDDLLFNSLVSLYQELICTLPYHLNMPIWEL